MPSVSSSLTPNTVSMSSSKRALLEMSSVVVCLSTPCPVRMTYSLFRMWWRSSPMMRHVNNWEVKRAAG
eukprot:1294153-Rhodomonas_salina.1